MATAYAPLPQEEILFASANLLVRRVAAGSGGLCYVTFDSYTDNRTLDRPGFGEAFLQSRGIDAVHVISRDNHWYQYPELGQALAAVAAATAGYGQVIAYGSSMGGFAALNYGAACGASIGIALSPQYSVDPRVVPFEARWADDVRRISFRADAVAPLATQYVVYDPRDAYDRQHYALFAARSPTIGIEVPHGGHPVGGYLSQTGLFQALFDAVHAGAFDRAAFVRELRARRRQSGQYFYALALKTPARRVQRKLALARLAAAASPADPAYLSYLGQVLDQAGLFDEAAAVHGRAVAMSQASLHPLHNLLLHHEAVGDLAEARRLAERLLAEHPGVALVRQSRERIRLKQRRERRWGRIADKLRLNGLLDWYEQRQGTLTPLPAL